MKLMLTHSMDNDTMEILQLVSDLFIGTFVYLQKAETEPG